MAEPVGESPFSSRASCALTAMNPSKRALIDVAILDENTDVWRAVLAESLGGDRFRIVEENTDSEDEHWAFSTDEVVQGVPHELCDGMSGLVARRWVG